MDLERERCAFIIGSDLEVSLGSMWTIVLLIARPCVLSLNDVERSPW